MSRKDSLLRLHQRLVAKRDALRKSILEGLKLSQMTDTGVGDTGDAAQDGVSSELDSQLAAFESRELGQIERAIEMIRKGRYGICESCQQSIPIDRLKAVPFTPLCVGCQRDQEETGYSDDGFSADWETACEFEGRMSETELTLGDLEAEL